MPCTCAAIRLTTAITPTGISRRPAPLAHPLTDASTQLSSLPPNSLSLPRPIPLLLILLLILPLPSHGCRQHAAKPMPMPPPPVPPAQVVQQSFFVTIIWPGTLHRLCPSDPPAPPGVCPLSTHHIRFADSIGQRRHCCCSEQRRRRRRPPPTARCRLAPALPASVSFNAHVKHIWSNAAWAAKVAVNAAVAPGPVLRRSSVRILPVHRW